MRVKSNSIESITSQEPKNKEVLVPTSATAQEIAIKANTEDFFTPPTEKY